MPDNIPRLCNFVDAANDPRDLHSASGQFQYALHDRSERVRQDAIGVFMIGRVIGPHSLIKARSPDFSEHSRQHSG